MILVKSPSNLTPHPSALTFTLTLTFHPNHRAALKKQKILAEAAERKRVADEEGALVQAEKGTGEEKEEKRSGAPSSSFAGPSAPTKAAKRRAKLKEESGEEEEEEEEEQDAEAKAAARSAQLESINRMHTRKKASQVRNATMIYLVATIKVQNSIAEAPLLLYI